jgi:hypothetical protein
MAVWRRFKAKKKARRFVFSASVSVEIAASVQQESGYVVTSAMSRASWGVVIPLLVVIVGLPWGVVGLGAFQTGVFGGGGCASGVRAGFDEFYSPCAAACSTSVTVPSQPPFTGDVGGAGAAALCAVGWHVCTVCGGWGRRGLGWVGEGRWCFYV